MKFISSYWALINKKTKDFYEVQDKTQVYNSREEARFMKFLAGNYKVTKVNVTVERIS